MTTTIKPIKTNSSQTTQLKQHPPTSALARVLGAGSAGFFELILFHPMDTMAKRLMSNQTRIFQGQSFELGREQLKLVLFREHAQSPPLKKFRALFPGFQFGLMFKVSQRIHRFGGQLVVRDELTKRYFDAYTRTFGEKYARPMLEATAGSLIGAAEVILLPFDVLKIKSQTNPKAIAGRSLTRILAEEGITNLYRGTLVTALRNAPGSFALFGGASLVRERVFGVSHLRESTLGQTFVASIAGSAASIIMASPFDVIKTRLQNKEFKSKISAWQIIKELNKGEGWKAYFKGLTPKFLSVGPKLVFSFTLSHYLIVQIDHFLHGVPHTIDDSPSNKNTTPLIPIARTAVVSTSTTNSEKE